MSEVWIGANNSNSATL